MTNGLSRETIYTFFMELSKRYAGNFAAQIQAGNENPELSQILSEWREKIPSVNIETLCIIHSAAFAILDIIAMNNASLADSAKQS